MPRTRNTFLFVTLALAVAVGCASDPNTDPAPCPPCVETPCPAPVYYTAGDAPMRRAIVAEWNAAAGQPIYEIDADYPRVMRARLPGCADNSAAAVYQLFLQGRLDLLRRLGFTDVFCVGSDHPRFGIVMTIESVTDTAVRELQSTSPDRERALRDGTLDSLR